MNKDHTFYFLLDYKKTRTAIKEKIDQYNADLQLSFESDKAAFRKKHSLAINQGYKACTVKSPDETTMWCILEMFGAYLQNNMRFKLMPENFRINNMAVCCKKSDRVVSSTVYRHIRRLIAAGVVKEKVFRGTNTSFDLVLNPDLIHLRQNSEYNFYLKALYEGMLGSLKVNPQAFKGIFSFSPTLAHFPFGLTLASCSHISTGIILQEHKINMESGIVSFDFPALADPSLENRAANDQKDKNKSEEGQKSGQENEKNSPQSPYQPGSGFQKNSARGGPENFEKEYSQVMKYGEAVNRAEELKEKKQFPKNESEQLWKEVLSFYCYAMAVLWPDRVVTIYERNKICAEIYKHFKKELANKPVYPTVYNFRGTFMLRILLTKKYCKKATWWNLESPTSYFDFDKKTGFTGTAAWADKAKEMEDKNKLYLDHYRKFINGWKDYTKQPNMQTYRAVAQTLGKLKHECWINYFNQSVANLNQLETTGTRDIWKTHYQA